MAPEALPYPGLVLAGGASRRMGRDKAGLRLPDGRTLLEHALAVLAAAVTGPLLVSTAGPVPPGRLQTWARAAGRAVAVCPDLRPGRGPLEGIRSGLRAVAPAAWLAVLAVDLPGAAPALWIHLAPRAGDDGPVLPVAGDLRQPLAGFWPAAVLPALEAFLDQGGRRVQQLLQAVPVRWQPVTAAGMLVNCNTPAEWAAWTGHPAGARPPAPGVE
ncbi:putative molybdenum cofactor guanylyltransferase [Candidatus Hydrogenisulfobacillus filiaventi]|uniref:Probable molybdenum cofactor guanylyltransferase n=1 Tax=Candidatus Hydrogenisulfobacillus filiaventi TaxID=2707344 RepID=A0A6F8ZJ40_9FIRM|nr:putative molybdenum cofactor guanylyltransferase [Candidatus Hydrogenisulfobacillus filiaventi]